MKSSSLVPPSRFQKLRIRDGNDNNGDEDDDEPETLSEMAFQTLEGLVVVAKILTLVILLAGAVFVAIIWQNSNVLHGYPKFASPDVPGDFVSHRYTWEWFIFAIMGLQWLVPYAVGLALVDPNKPILSRIAQFLCLGVALLLAAMAIAILVTQWCWCNSGFYTENLCTEVRACCETWPTATSICPNVVDCTPQPAELKSSQLFRWTLWAALGFFILDLVAYTVLDFVADYGFTSLRTKSA